MQRVVVFSATNEHLAIEVPPLFKIRPCPDGFPKPPATHAHHAHFLDYQVRERKGIVGVTEYSYSLESPPLFEDLPKFPIPDGIVLARDAAERLKEILDVVNALGSRHVIRYRAYQAWFTELGAGASESRWGQEMYHHPSAGLPDTIDPTPGFEAMDEIVLQEGGQDHTRVVRLADLLRLYFHAPDSRFKRLFRDACRVAARARYVAQFDLSTSFLLLVSSIESLIHIKHVDQSVERCGECGQERYRVVRKFKEFLDEYSYEIAPSTKQRIYQLRSNLVHRGQFLPLDGGQGMYLETADDLKATLESTMSSNDYRLTQQATTACFRTFLYRRLAN